MEELFDSKQQLLDAILSERLSLEETLTGVDPETFEAPLLDSGWSVKDAVAHITSWEQDMLCWLDDSLKGDKPERPSFNLSTDIVDTINVAFYQANREKSRQQVLDEAKASFRDVRAALQQVNDTDLFDPDRFAWLEGRAFWPIFAANTCWHYNEHRIDIQKRLIVN